MPCCAANGASDMMPDVKLHELESALENGEFVYYYQPKISLVTGRISGAEALIRWIRTDGKIVLPNRFIPLAESSGFITEISQAMFPKLVTDALIVNDVNAKLVTAFNLSAKDFENRHLLHAIQDASGRIDPARLGAELTEASVIGLGNSRALGNLRELAESGIRLAMDDFGTGYSSIDTLSRLPFDIIKLDQGLISRMSDSERSATIVLASIRMAHQLGMEIVAEGIETASAYDFLLHAGCTEVQGFWIARPMPLDDYLAFIRKDHIWTGLPTGLIHMAILDHVQWRQQLISRVTSLAFNGKVDEAAIRASNVEVDHHQCKLGRWYYGVGQAFRGHPVFDRLEEPHRLLHQAGFDLLESASQGMSRSELTRQMRMLTHQSSRIIELLQELESEAMIDLSLRNA